MMLQLALTKLNNKTYDETVAIHGSSEDIIGQLVNGFQRSENPWF